PTASDGSVGAAARAAGRRRRRERRNVRIGLALPQYDYSVAGERPLRWETVAAHATRAEQLGYDSLWVSDHLFLDLARYGGSAARVGVFDPLVSLAALARTVARPRLGV